MNIFRFFTVFCAIGFMLPSDAARAELPAGFVYLADMDAGIVQDMRYAGSHNFVGRPIAGYQAAECILAEATARALAKAQAQLSAQKLSLMGWDCYRPERAVADFVAWSRIADDTRMKAEFYPRTDKSKSFALGYIASRSGHSRGGTVDIGIVPKSVTAPPVYDPVVPLRSCIEPKARRFDDGAIDFGTGYDCFDERAATRHPGVGREARANRQLLATVMERAGFGPYAKEWWHFTLIKEPFPNQGFDFPVVGRGARAPSGN